MRRIPEAATPRRFPMARSCRIAAWLGTGLHAAEFGLLWGSPAELSILQNPEHSNLDAAM